MRRDRLEPLAAGPAHCRRMRMDAPALAVFPDAGIGLEREGRGLLAKRLEHAKQVLVAHARQPPVEEHRRRGKDHAAVSIVLVLRHRGVADAHRAVAAIAFQVGDDALVERIGRHDRVHRLQLAGLPGHDGEDVGDVVSIVRVAPMRLKERTTK